MSLILPPLPLLSPPSTNSSDTSPPPSTPSAPPPSPPQESPPVVSSPPPSPPVVSSPPPSPPVVSSPPPSPPVVSSPPPSPPVDSSPPPAVVSSPPPPVSNSPPSSSPVEVSPPPPQPSPATPAATPPTPLPPAETPPTAKPSPSTPAATPPPSTPAVKPPPVTSTPPPSSLPANPSPPGPPTPLPEIPKEKPTARPTGPATNDRNSTLALSSSSPNVSPGGAVAIGIVVGLVLLSLLLLGVWFTRRRKRKDTGTFIGYTMPSAYASPQGSDIVLLNSHSSAPKMRSNSGSDYMYSPSESGGVVNNQRSVFSYDELSQSTNGFSEKNLLGEGGFGCVYKGVLGDGREIAVKQLKIGGSQGEREFRAEVEIISRVHHRHLVTLVGYCISEQHRLLVYDYVPNNTLHFHLHAQGRPVMTWATRVKVATGAARGIAYLHEDCHPRIIHRDIKSSNILLDNSFEALVADFGLAKIAQELDLNTHISTRVMGTFGYLAPEYATSGKLSEKSDVYSYGVILLELITGRIPVDTSQPLGEESLVEWARPLLNGAIEHAEFDELVDPRLGKKYVPGEMFRMVEAAAACVRHSAAKRPKMSQVVRALDTMEEATDITNGMKPGQSQMMDSREQSAQIKMFQRMAFGTQDYSSNFFDRSQSSWESRDQSRFIP